jgi:hypothetical protein
MTTLRVALHRWSVIGIAAWSLLVLMAQTFKGGGVGGWECDTDPTCGEIGWIPAAAWVGGIMLTIVIGYASRPAGEPVTTTKDKVVGLAVALGILVLVAVTITLVQEPSNLAP